MNNNTDSRWEDAHAAYLAGDKKGALFLLRSLANDGELAVYREIGNIYEIGGGGVEQDFQKASTWYKKSVDEANDAYGAFGLGRLYYNGKGVERDYEKALFYFKLAADSDIELANLMLGRMYRFGYGVNKDLSISREYFTKACDAGYVQAIKNLGLLELEDKNIVKGVFYQLKGIFLHLFISLKNKRDVRLRSS